MTGSAVCVEVQLES